MRSDTDNLLEDEASICQGLFEVTPEDDRQWPQDFALAAGTLESLIACADDKDTTESEGAGSLQALGQNVSPPRIDLSDVADPLGVDKREGYGRWRVRLGRGRGERGNRDVLSVAFLEACKGLLERLIDVSVKGGVPRHALVRRKQAEGLQQPIVVFDASVLFDLVVGQLERDCFFFKKKVNNTPLPWGPRLWPHRWLGRWSFRYEAAEDRLCLPAVLRH